MTAQVCNKINNTCDASYKQLYQSIIAVFLSGDNQLTGLVFGTAALIVTGRISSR
jgi:hypothetical protein